MQQVDKEVSNVVYVQIIGERADSKDTLVNVIGNLYQTFVLQQGQKSSSGRYCKPSYNENLLDETDPGE